MIHERRDVLIPSEPMKSASGEAAKYKYHLYIAPGGRKWVYPDDPAAADQVWEDGGLGSEGSGGRTLTFELVDGSSVDLIGPWRCASRYLKKAGGPDLSDRHLGQVWLGEKFEASYGGYCGGTMLGCFYSEDGPTVGKFASDRAKDLAKKYAAEMSMTVIAHAKSWGGSSTFPTEPEGEAP